ncbi:hypothetical protein [Acinetobacter bereziniae]|uniref:hypothetical protein n=1 Tax=Acinetobacter bereziniae TaxID=106648 RepID=UPI0035714B88
MKKLLLATLCASALALTACDKKPADAASGTNSKPAAAAVSLSTNNAADIKSDLTALQTMSTAKAKEALNFQTEVMQAAQKGDKDALKGVVDKMKTYVDGFNKDLDGLALKSTEVASVRDKMKESNNLGVEMSEAGLASSPDPQKIMELQKKGTELQQSLLTEMQALQTKANAAP